MTTSPTTGSALRPDLGTPGPVLPRLLRSEWLKLITTSMWWWFAIGTLVWTLVALAANIWMASLAADDPAFAAELGGVMYHATNIYTSGQYLGLLFVMLIGIVMVTSEYFHHTATTTFLATPHRTLVVMAKLLVAMGISVFYWLLTTVIALIGGALYFATTEHGLMLDEWEVHRAILWNLVAFVVWAVLGIGIGTLITNQLAATIIATAVYLIGTEVAGLLFWGLSELFNNPTIWEFQVLVPSIASRVLVSGGEGIAGVPAWWLGALVLLAYATVAGVVGVLVTRRRDIS